jgi:hypothetical protein
MRRRSGGLAALGLAGVLVLGGCHGRNATLNAERARPASLAQQETTPTIPETPTSSSIPDASVAATTPPASVSGSSSGGSTGSGNASSRDKGSSPPYGGSFAPGEPYPVPPYPSPAPQPAPPPYPWPQPAPPPQPHPQPPPPTPPCCKGTHGVGWESYAASSDGRTLTFTYWSGVDSCTRFDHASVDESASRVVVTIYEEDITNGNPCVAMAQQKHATVTLQSPLGNRQVVDGAR